MDAKSTVGVRVKLTISEPWEGSGESVLATVEAEAGGAWLLRLDEPLVGRGVSYERLVCSPRHSDSLMPVIASGSVFSCNATGIPPERQGSGDPFDLSWWHGGGTLGGIITMKKPGPMI